MDLLKIGKFKGLVKDPVYYQLIKHCSGSEFRYLEYKNGYHYLRTPWHPHKTQEEIGILDDMFYEVVWYENKPVRRYTW